MNKLSLLTFRYMKVNYKRTITTCIGVIISTVLIYIIFSVGYSLYFSETEEEYKDYTLMCDAIIECDGDTAKEIVYSADYYGKNNNKAEVELSYAWAVSSDKKVNMIYVNDFLAIPRPLKIIKGTFPKNDNSVMLPEWYKYNGINLIGAKFDLESRQAIDTPNAKVVSGYYGSDFHIPSSRQEIYMMFDGAIYSNYGDRVFDSDKVFVFVTFKDGNDIREKLDKLKEVYGITSTELSEYAEVYYNPESDLTYATFRAFLLILAFVGIVVAIVIIRNAFNISVHTRSRDYGILRCIGMSRKQIIIIILGEAFVISIIGLLIGITLGHGLSVYVFGLFKKILGLSAFFRIRIIPEAIILSAVAVMIATFYSMISPVEKLYKINPINSLRMTDEYKLDKKKLKANRGRLIGKLFGVEAGYAYKNILRDKKRFLLLTVSLTIWTILATTVLTTISAADKSIYDMTAPPCVYDGQIDSYDLSEAKYMADAVDSTGEVKSTFMKGIAMISIKENDFKTNYTCYGFPEEVYNEFADISDGYVDDENKPGVLIFDNNDKEPGDILCGNLYVNGEIKDFNRFAEVFTRYSSFSLSSSSFSRTIIYNIEDEKKIFKTVKPDIYWYEIMVEFKNENKHPEFDKLINDGGYYFSDYLLLYKSMMSSLKVVKTAVVTFLIFIFVLYMINTVNTNSSEMILRKKEINILRTIGMSKKQVNKMLYLEGIIISIIAAVIGNIFGCIAGNGIIYFMLFSGQEEGEFAFSLHIDILGILFIIVLLLLINIFAVWITKPEEEDIVLE